MANADSPTNLHWLSNNAGKTAPTSSAVSTGKWLTPVTEHVTASNGLPQAMARSMQKFPTS